MQTKFFSSIPFFGQERTQKFSSVILTLLALSFFGFFAINPTISTILRLQKELSNNGSINDQLGIKIRNLNKLGEQYLRIQNDLPVITDAITTKPDAHLLLAQIQTAATQSNIKIKTLQSLEIKVISNDNPEGKKYFTYSFVVAGSGDSKSIFSFVSAITNMQRVVSIDIFSLNTKTENNSQSLEFNIQGTAFFKE